MESSRPCSSAGSSCSTSASKTRWGCLVLSRPTPTRTMNGYGHFVPALLWSNVYWTAIFAVLAVLSIALTRRGAEDGWHVRAEQGRRRLPGLVPALSFFALIAIGKRTLVLLQRACAERVFDQQTAARHPGEVRERLQEVRTIPPAEGDRCRRRYRSRPRRIVRSPAPPTSCCRTRLLIPSSRSTSLTRCSQWARCSSTAHFIG